MRLKRLLTAVFYIFCSSMAFGQSLFPVRDTQSGLYGFKNAQTFKWAIHPKFTSAEPFLNGRALVTENNLYGLIDKQGKYSIPPIYNQLEGDRFLTFAEKETSGIISATGKILLTGKFNHLYYEPTLGAAILMKDDLFGYWDTLGNYIEPFSKYELSFENNLSYFNSGKTHGFIDKQGKKIIEIEEGELWDVSPFGYISKNKNKECVFDENGKQVGDCNFDIIVQMRKGLIVYSRDEKYGVINYKAEDIVPNEYDYISPFNHSGIALVKKDSLFGLMNENAALILPIENEVIQEYGSDYNRLLGTYKNYHPYTLFKVKGFYGILNDSGNVIKEPNLELASVEDTWLRYVQNDTLRVVDLKSGKKIPLARAYKFVKEKAVFCFADPETKCGIATKKGKIFVPPVYQKLIPVGTNGYTIAKNKKGSGMLDTSGSPSIPLVYADILPLDDIFKEYFPKHGDYAWDGYLYSFTKNNKVGVMQESGQLIVDTAYINCTTFDEDGRCWMVETKKGWKIINEKGKKLSLTLASPTIFNQEVAIGKKGKKYGLISPLGKTILPFKYDRISEEPFGIYFACRDSLWGLVNRKGEMLAVPQFNSKTSFHSTYAFVKKENSWGVINSAGIYKKGFEELANDSLNIKILNNAKILSFSYSDLSGFDELSFDLLQSHERSKTMEHINSHILNSMQKFFINKAESQEALLVKPLKKDSTVRDIEYRGMGIEIVSIGQNTITLNSFMEEFDKEKEINESKDQLSVYLITNDAFTKLTLQDLFNAEGYLQVLNALVKEESAKHGFIVSSNTPQDSLVFDQANFSLLNDELVLRLNEKAFLGNEEFFKATAVLIPYEKIKSIVKVDGPLKEFYE